jgi:hypothetical protein
MKRKVQDFYIKWIMFKNARNANQLLSSEDSRFISVLEREALIDILFDEILGK